MLGPKPAAHYAQLAVSKPHIYAPETFTLPHYHACSYETWSHPAHILLTQHLTHTSSHSQLLHTFSTCLTSPRPPSPPPWCCLLPAALQVLSQQAAQASGDESAAAAAPLPPSAQRRLVRILRDLDAHAVEKLLLWESYWKEAEQRDADSHKLRRLKERVTAAVKALDQQAVRREGRREGGGGRGA